MFPESLTEFAEKHGLTARVGGARHYRYSDTPTDNAEIDMARKEARFPNYYKIPVDATVTTPTSIIFADWSLVNLQSEENIKPLCEKLSKLRTPVFVFCEGKNFIRAESLFHFFCLVTTIRPTPPQRIATLARQTEA